MTHWVRFKNEVTRGFGKLSDGQIAIHEGDMFADSTPSGVHVLLDDVTLLMPCVPCSLSYIVCRKMSM